MSDQNSVFIGSIGIRRGVLASVSNRHSIFIKFRLCVCIVATNGVAVAMNTAAWPGELASGQFILKTFSYLLVLRIGRTDRRNILKSFSRGFSLRVANFSCVLFIYIRCACASWEKCQGEESTREKEKLAMLHFHQQFPLSERRNIHFSPSLPAFEMP